MTRFFVDFTSAPPSVPKTRKVVAVQVAADVFRRRILSEEGLTQAVETLRRLVDVVNDTHRGKTVALSVSQALTLSAHGWIRIYQQGGPNDAIYILNISVCRIDGELVARNIPGLLERSLEPVDTKVAEAFADIYGLEKGGVL